MRLIFKSLTTFILLSFSLIGGKFIYAQGTDSISNQISFYTKQMMTARLEYKASPDSSFLLFKESYNFFSTQKDTGKMVSCLMGMSRTQNQKGKFSLSFDHLWEALYLARSKVNSNQKAQVHIQLARLYDSFNMRENVLYHLNEAVAISKALYEQNDKNIDELIASYMNLAVIHRKTGNYELALNYLDSCFVNDWVVKNRSVEMPFWNAEHGYIMLKQKNYEESAKYLHEANDFVSSETTSYTHNIKLYLGELYLALGDNDKAILYLSECLDLIRKQKLLTEIETDALLRLSDVYFAKGNTSKAYNLLQEAQITGQNYVQLKNQTNSELFEIKNTYLESISKKNEQLEQQSLLIRQNKQIQQRLKIILALVVLLAAVLIVVIRMRLKLRKTLMQKEATELQASIEKERNQNQLESKSKELTSYALQLIDKDTAIDELLKVLQKESPMSYKPLNNKFRKGSQDLWDEFNLRFTEVNSAFYDRLQHKHPNLSITEQKHCALIKLNFATKEMARILNIETHSVHMSRSRIRKKIGMERADSLEKYIAEL